MKGVQAMVGGQEKETTGTLLSVLLPAGLISPEVKEGPWANSGQCEH